MIAAQTITVTAENRMLDLVLWRRLKRFVPGYLELVLEANIGLAQHLEFIPVGTVINLPAFDEKKQLESDVVYLWG